MLPLFPAPTTQIEDLALGNYDEAFVWFERAYEQREGILQWLKVHPFFDPVRNHPRFKQLQRRVGLDESR
jgi:hypothetical protein